MNVSINVDFGGIDRMLSTGNVRKAQLALAERVKTDSNRYCKVLTGDTQASAKVSDEGRLVSWDTPYAGYAYAKGKPNKALNPLASLRWFDVAQRLHSRDWAKVAGDALCV